MDATEKEGLVGYLIENSHLYQRVEDSHWYRKTEDMYIERVFKDSTAAQNVHTPDSLCADIVAKLKENCIMNGRNVLILNPEWARLLANEDGINLTFVSDCPKKSKYVRGFYPRVNVIETDFLTWDTKDMKKFDVIVMNPPYQKKGEGKGSDNVLWPHFIKKSFDLLKDEGYIASINPSGWREPNVGNSNLYKRVGLVLKSHDIIYLEIHNEEDSHKNFGVSTRYDIYIARNSKSNIETTVVDEDGIKTKIDIKSMPFIPNKLFDIFKGLLEEDPTKRLSLISDSTYHIRDCVKRGTMTKEKNGLFQYPCIRYISEKGGGMDLYYSSVQRGHFGIPKVVFGNQAAVGTITIDDKGDFGLTQFVTGIVTENVKNLSLIKKAMETYEFKKIMEACRFTTQKINQNVLSLFRNDFWKKFVDEKGNEI